MKNAKKITSVILAIAMLFSVLSCVPLPAFAATSGDYEYKLLADGTAEITKYTGTDAVVEIPSELDGYTVTSLDRFAFNVCKSLTSVTIPYSVTSISDSVFTNCINLTDITVDSANEKYSSQDGVVFNKDKTELVLYPVGNRRTLYEVPEGVKRLANSSFKTSSNLTSVTLPDGLTSIGGSAFGFSDNFQSITIPESVTYIGGYAFQYCPSLTDITVDSANESYSSQDGVLFNKGKTVLIQYPTGNVRTSYEIPDGVKSIDLYAFDNCDSLTSVKTPDSLTEISSFAFRNCASLKSITIQYGVTSIGLDAFNGCTSLESITIPDSVTSIGEFAFFDCTSLTDVAIGNGVTSIGDYTFFSCESLKSITIPNSVTSIGSRAFSYCTSLTGITIPDSVTSIGSYAFSSCKSLKSITIPDSVTSIDNYAFSYCTSLTGIVIMNAECDIDNNRYTISDTATIIGYRNSTAQQYAQDFDREFVALDDFDCASDNHCYILIEQKAATCTEAGFANYECVLCGKTKNETFAAKHSYVNGFCSICREKDPDFIFPLISVDETKTVNIENGGDIVYFVFVPEESATYVFYASGAYDTYGHLYDENLEELASDDDGADGYNFRISYYLEADQTYYFACRMYYSSKLGSFDVTLQHLHSYNSVVTEPTCTERGYTTYTCSECGDSYVDSYVSAKGHSYDSGKVTKEATYTAPGVKTYTCKNCGATKTETIPKKTLATPKLSAVKNTETGVNISWGKVDGAAKYRVFYKAADGSWKGIANTTSTSYTWTGAKSGTKYTFTVRCLDEDGNYISSFDSTGKSITYIAAPKLSAVKNTETGVNISWGKVTGAAKYRVFYKTADGSWKGIANTTSTSYTWTGAKSGTKYTFTVRCLDKDGNYISSFDSTGKSITYIAAPKLLSVENTATGIKITWAESTGAEKYGVYYKTDNGDWKKIAPTTSTSYTWKGGEAGTKYSFTVRCTDKDCQYFTSAYDTNGKSITKK